jgi:hypothetical protein
VPEDVRRALVGGVKKRIKGFLLWIKEKVPKEVREAISAER